MFTCLHVYLYMCTLFTCSLHVCLHVLIQKVTYFGNLYLTLFQVEIVVYYELVYRLFIVTVTVKVIGAWCV